MVQSVGKVGDGGRVAPVGPVVLSGSRSGKDESQGQKGGGKEMANGIADVVQLSGRKHVEADAVFPGEGDVQVYTRGRVLETLGGRVPGDYDRRPSLSDINPHS